MANAGAASGGPQGAEGACDEEAAFMLFLAITLVSRQLWLAQTSVVSQAAFILRR